MKAPEEYLAQQGGFFPNDNTSRAYFEQDALAALKAMQSDHDAEMMGLKEKLSNTEDWLVITKTSRRTWKKKYEELLTQFRKG